MLILPSSFVDFSLCTRVLWRQNQEPLKSKVNIDGDAMSFVNKLIARTNHLPALQEEDRAALLPLQKGSIIKRATSTKVIKRAFNSFLYGNPRFSIPDIGLNVAQASALKHLLSLQTSKPLLSTTIAWTGYPVARKEKTVFPASQCAVHTWLNPDMLWHLTFLIAKELHWHSKGLWALPPHCLPPDVREMLHVTLKPLLTVFGDEKGLHNCPELPNVEIIKYPLDAFKEAGKGRECVACTLHLIFRNEAAVNALATLCKGRKKPRRKWPQLLAFLEPTNVEAEEDCFRRWRREGRDVRRARNRVRRWKECGGVYGGMNEMSVQQNAETGLVPLVWSPTRDAEFDRAFAASKAAMNPDEAGSRLQNKRMTVLEYVLDDRRTEKDDEVEKDADGLCEDEWDDESILEMDSPTLVASSSEGGSSPKDLRPKFSPANYMSDSFGMYDPSKMEEDRTSGLRHCDHWSVPKSPPRYHPPRSK